MADSSLNAGVWERTGGEHALSKNLFAFLVCFWTTAGIAGWFVTAYNCQGLPPSLWLLLGAFVVSVVGIIVALASSNPLVSLLGYSLVILPMGVITGPVFAQFEHASIMRILFLTGGVTAVLGLVGAVIPDSLEGWGSWLLGALTLLILGQVGVIIAAAMGLEIGRAMTILDWVGVVLFSGYIIYDFNRAMHVERTHDNAIDCALAVFLDFINLFLRLLSLFGQKK